MTRAPSRTRLAALTIPALLLVLTTAACGPRYQRIRLFEHRNLSVLLRAEVRDGETVPRNFSHPATISSVRLAHVLSRLDVRMGGEENDKSRQAAFPTALLYTVGEQVALAFEEADPSQEIVVTAVRSEKRLGLFTAKYLTSFVTWMQGEDLYIHLSRVEWPVPKGDEDELPEPWVHRRSQDFKALAAEGVVPVGEQTLAVDWRNPIFRKPTHLRIGAGGKLLRRQILLEAPAEEEVVEEVPIVPADLSSDVLRALADLQDQRQRGEISETRYHQARRDLLRQASDAAGGSP
ncbi:MAG: hypothetical protein OEP95_10285 [Myxococcales bacterium]|nr:hypothetical protein [Myxococcales bacterium]